MNYNKVTVDWAVPLINQGVPIEALTEVLITACGYTPAIAKRVLRAITQENYNEYSICFEEDSHPPGWHSKQLKDNGIELIFSSLEPNVELFSGLVTVEDFAAAEKFEQENYDIGKIRNKISFCCNWPLDKVIEHTSLSPNVVFEKNTIAEFVVYLDSTNKVVVSAIDNVKYQLTVRPPKGSGMLTPTKERVVVDELIGKVLRFALIR